MGLHPVSVERVAFGLRPVCPQSLVWKLVGAAERVMAGLFLVVIFPALAAAALAIAFLSRRSPLIAHLRVGQHGRNIWVLKLRTMWQQRSSGCRLRPFIERLTGEEIPESKSQTDARVTSRFAAVCRKYSVDEWPQLWHVIRGEMALVGPRPLTAAELDRYYGSSTALLLSVKPGITGLWQVKGRSRLTYPQRRRLDLFLIHHRCLRLYARILNATIPRVVTGKDAW